MDDIYFITKLTEKEKGISFLLEHIDKSKDLTLLYFRNYISEPPLFEKNSSDIVKDIEEHLEDFWTLYSLDSKDFDEIWNTHLIPYLNKISLEFILEKDAHIVNLITNHPQWLGDNPINSIVSKNLDLLSTFLKNKKTRDKTFEWINFIRTSVHNHQKKEITTQNFKYITEVSAFYVRILKLFVELLNHGLQDKENYVKIKSDACFTNTNFMTLMFSTIIQIINKNYMSIDEEIYVRKNFITILNERIEMIINIIQNSQAPLSLQMDILSVEKIKLEMQIDFEEERILQIKKEKEICKPVIDIFCCILFNWINSVIDKKIEIDSIDDALNCFSELLEPNKIDNTIINYIEAILNSGKDALTLNPDIKINTLYLMYHSITTDITFNYSDDIVKKLAECVIYVIPKLSEYNIATKLRIKNKIMYIFVKLLGNYTIKDELICKKLVIIIFGYINEIISQKELMEKKPELKETINTGLFYYMRITLILIDVLFNIKMIRGYILSNEVIGVFIEMFSSSLNHLLKNNEEKYPDYTAVFLQHYEKLIECLYDSDKFITTLVEHEMYDTIALMIKLKDNLTSQNKLTNLSYSIMTLVIDKAKKIKENKIEPDEIPDEFCDPLMYTLIENPVELPHGDIIMEKNVICRHLLTEEFDPFNRTKLTLDMLNAHNEKEDVKMKLQEFIEKEKVGKKV